MKYSLFYNQTLFRLLAPLPIGILIYMLVLLVFDNLSSLGEVFFDQEALLFIVITYVLSETLRVVTNGLAARTETAGSVRGWLILLFLIGLLATLALVAGLITAYFVWVVEYSWGTFFTELTTSVSIYGFIYVLYFMVLTSVILFAIESRRAVEKESLLKKNIDLKLKIFSRVINPEFLYRSLETLITIIRRKEPSAEKFIQKLSHVYRSVLDNRHEDLAGLQTEMHAADSIVYLYNQQHDGHIRWEPLEYGSDAEEVFVLPGSMMIVLEWVINSNMINASKPLHISVRREDDYLVVEYTLWEKLVLAPEAWKKVEELVQSFEYFTRRPLLIVKAADRGYVKIPLLTIDRAA